LATVIVVIQVTRIKDKKAKEKNKRAVIFGSLNRKLGRNGGGPGLDETGSLLHRSAGGLKVEKTEKGVQSGGSSRGARGSW